MAERLPPPPTSLPPVRAGEVFTAPSGTRFGRIYLRAGAHPAAWNTFRSFGPVSTMRFDHQPAPARPHRTRAITYVASDVRSDGGHNDPLETCLLEFFAATRVIDVRAGTPAFTVWTAGRPLRLLDVVDSPWVSRCGGNAAISSGVRGTSRLWSRKIYAAYADIDGIYYGTSNAPAQRSIALFERARNALPLSPSFDRELADPALVRPVRRVRRRYDLGFIP